MAAAGGKSAIICNYSILWEEMLTLGHTTVPRYEPIYIHIAARCTFYYGGTITFIQLPDAASQKIQ